MAKFIMDIVRGLRSVTIVEWMVIMSIIAIIAAMLLPAFARAKERAEWQAKHPGETYHYNSHSRYSNGFQVGDSVSVRGLDVKGTVNYVSGSGYLDIIATGKDGQPIKLEGINPAIVNKN